MHIPLMLQKRRAKWQGHEPVDIDLFAIPNEAEETGCVAGGRGGGVYVWSGSWSGSGNGEGEI